VRESKPFAAVVNRRAEGDRLAAAALPWPVSRHRLPAAPGPV